MRSTAATLLEILKVFLRQEPDGPFAVGYSGGRDSAVLLWALVQVVGADRVTALHIDHGWRSEEERSAEADLVRRWCADLGVRLRAFGPPLSVVPTEAAAREYRYAAFREFLNSHPDAAIYLAHHADDQAETVLMRLLKGRSWQGLSGIPERRGPFRRPLLAVRRDFLGKVALENRIPWHEDSTNSQTKPARNFLRTILPQLSARFPRAVNSLNEFAGVWKGVHVARQPSADWRSVPGGSVVGAAWTRWSPLERQAELLALAARSGGAKLSRRFLETVCTGDRNLARSGTWTWRQKNGEVFWGQVAPSRQKEYFICVVQGREYELGTYRFVWNPGQTGLQLPVNPKEPWYWRSIVPGMQLISSSGPWSREERKRRLGSLHPARTALVVQHGLIVAAVDPLLQKLLWTDKGEKLHKPGIFVTLVAVMTISTEKL